jgi:hypothetical protein
MAPLTADIGVVEDDERGMAAKSAEIRLIVSPISSIKSLPIPSHAVRSDCEV